MPSVPPFIAIVDDEETIRRALVRLLRSAGMEARAYASGQSFLETLPHSMPRCVILDLHMPGLSGLDVQAALAKSHPQLPVIFITGHQAPETEVRVLATRPLAFLTKPVHDQVLFDVIASLP